MNTDPTGMCRLGPYAGFCNGQCALAKIRDNGYVDYEKSTGETMYIVKDTGEGTWKKTVKDIEKHSQPGDSITVDQRTTGKVRGEYTPNFKMIDSYKEWDPLRIMENILIIHKYNAETPELAGTIPYNRIIGGEFLEYYGHNMGKEVGYIQPIDDLFGALGSRLSQSGKDCDLDQESSWIYEWMFK